MSASRFKGRFLRGLDRLLDAGEHPPKPDAHAADRLSPLLQVLRRLRRLGARPRTPQGNRQRFQADMAAFRAGFAIGSSQDLSIPPTMASWRAACTAPVRPPAVCR